MEKKRAFTGIFLSVAGLALVCHIIAMATPGWCIIKVDGDTETVVVGINPFYVSAKACVELAGSKQCIQRDVALDDYATGYDTADEMSLFWPSRIFGITGLIAIFVSGILSYVWSRNKYRDGPHGAIALTGWILSVACLALAIGIQSSKFSVLYEMDVEFMKTEFPYSILMCAFSMVFCVAAFIFSVIGHCTRKEEVPFMYNQFANPPVQVSVSTHMQPYPQAGAYPAGQPYVQPANVVMHTY